MTSSRTLRVVLVAGRGRAFERPGVVVRAACDDDERDEEEFPSTSASTTIDSSSKSIRATWCDDALDVRASDASTCVRLIVCDASGEETARAMCALVGGRAGRGTRDVVVPGRWCETRRTSGGDDDGAVVGEVCVRVIEVREGAVGAVERAVERVDGKGAAEARGDDAEPGRNAESTVESVEETSVGAGRGVNVAVGWLRGLARRQSEDENARAAEKEARRREREAQIAEKRVRKERERIEREEAQAAARERKIELERLRAEEKRQWDAERAEEKRRREEERAAARADAADPSSPRRSTPWNRATSDEGGSAQSPASGARSPIHVPNVEEIKNAVREGAHHLGEVAHHIAHDVSEHAHHLGEVAHHIAHDVSEHAHHVGDALRQKNERLGKALAKRRWIRDIASKVSPNALLVAAIAVFLAGLPENRKRAKQKVRSLANRPVGSFGAERASDEEMQPEEDWRTEVIYNLNDIEEEDPPYIGRGPTPRGVYEVVEGDTLCSIAGCFNLDVVEIIDRNGDVIKNPEELSPGARIRIY